MVDNSTFLLLFFLFLALSAFISALEVAYLAIQKSQVRHLVSSGVVGGREVERITQAPERLLATTLFSNNLVQTGAATVGTIVAISWFGRNWGAVVATVGIALATLLLAEAIPKTFAARNAQRLALFFARPFRALEASLSPVVSAISWLTSRATGGPLAAPSYQVSEEEIRSIISIGQEEGAVEPAQAEMLHKVFEFGDRPAREVMTPRADIVALEKGSTVEALLQVYTQTPYSRFPVYDESLDNLLGLVSIKDLLLAQAQGGLSSQSTIDDLVRPLPFVPETKPLSQLFRELQTTGYHMAAVVDEYGGIAGIVTTGDLVEEIMGKMRDELGAPEVATIDEKTFQVEGGLRIEEANQELGLAIPPGEYETVAGFVLSQLGHIPREGEHFKYNGWKVVVVQVRGRRIHTVLITRE